MQRKRNISWQWCWSREAWILSEPISILPLPSTRLKEESPSYCRTYCVSTVPQRPLPNGWRCGGKSTFLTTDTLAQQFEICMALSTVKDMEVRACKHLRGKKSMWSIYTNTDCTAWTHKKARPSSMVIILRVITPCIVRHYSWKMDHCSSKDSRIALLLPLVRGFHPSIYN